MAHTRSAARPPAIFSGASSGYTTAQFCLPGYSKRMCAVNNCRYSTYALSQRYTGVTMKDFVATQIALSQRQTHEAPEHCISTHTALSQNQSPGRLGCLKCLLVPFHKACPHKHSICHLSESRPLKALFTPATKSSSTILAPQWEVQYVSPGSSVY